MFLSNHVSCVPKRKNAPNIDTVIDHDPNFKGVDDMQDHVFITELVIGNILQRIYWTKDEFLLFCRDGFEKLKELERMEIDSTLKRIIQ